jgi:enoyl-CoA hydratase/carnithine racemase
MLGHRARDESSYRFVLRHQQKRLAVMDSPKPFIAALKGAALARLRNCAILRYPHSRHHAQDGAA